VDFRFAVDNDGELYLLTKSDGMIRKVVGAKATALTAVPSSGPGVRASTDVKSSDVPLDNPVAASPESVAAGKKAYDVNCAACHGNMAQGAVNAGIRISIIDEQGGKQAPDLTDDHWDHGSTDREIYLAIKKGVPPTMMAGWDGRIPDNDIWNIVNYLRTLAPKKQAATTPLSRPTSASPARP
jgi:cytochrome c oxidase cbb3-type subunit 3